MRNVFWIAVVGALGLAAAPMAASPAQADQGAAAAEVLLGALPQTVDGWDRRAVTPDDLDRLFGIVQGAQGDTTAPRATTEVVQTARRGRRSVQSSEGEAVPAQAAISPLRRKLDTMIDQARGFKSTARRGRRQNPGTAPAPVLAYQRADDLVVLVAGTGAAPLAALSDGIEIASQDALVAQLAGDAFLTVSDVTFVEVGDQAAAPTQVLIGTVGEHTHLLVLAQADRDSIHQILGSVDFGPLRLWAPATGTEGANSGRTKRSRR